MNDVDVLVVGGGISGLAAAWWLARQDLSVAVWERAQCPGGKIRSDSRAGYTTEQAAAIVMNYRPEVDRLVTEAGLDEAKVVKGPCANRYLVRDGRLTPVPMTVGAMMASPLWSARGRVRMAIEPFIPRGRRAHETVGEFITRRLGSELLHTAMEPYVAGPLASDPARADAGAVLPRLRALEERYGSIGMGVLAHRLLGRRTACSPRAFSFRAGMTTLVEALANTPAVGFQPGCALTALELCESGWRATGTRGGWDRSVRARQVVLSVPAHAAAAVLRPLDRRLGELLGGIEYAPLAVVHMGFDRRAIRHPLDGTGFLVARREPESRVLNGNLWMSSLIPGCAPPEKALLTSYLGGARRPEAADWDDELCVSRVMETLEPLIGLRGEPDMLRVDRHRRGLPLYHGAYQRRLRAVDERVAALPGLQLAGNYQGGISVRDRIVCARAVASRVCAELAHDRGATGSKSGTPALNMVASR